MTPVPPALNPHYLIHALALSSGLSHAGDWLNVAPSPTLGLHLQNREGWCSLRYWLGVPLHNNPCLECSATADIFGDHQVCCGGNGDHISRHSSIRDVVFIEANRLPQLPQRRTLVWYPAPSPTLLTFYFQAGCVVALPPQDIHVTSPFSNRPSHGRQSPKALLYRWRYNTSLPPTSQHAVKPELTASP